MGLSELNVYRLNYVWGITDIILSTLGLYFVYRYVVAVLTISDDDRDILLGPAFSRWLPTTDQFITILGALYLGFRVTHLLVAGARWELSMRKQRENLVKEKKLEDVEREGGEVRRLDLNKASTFTG